MGIWPAENSTLVCWQWRSEWSFARILEFRFPSAPPPSSVTVIKFRVVCHSDSSLPGLSWNMPQIIKYVITRRPSDRKIDAWRPSVSSFRRQSIEQSAVNRHRRSNFVFFPPSLKNSFIYCFVSILTYNLSQLAA